MAARNNAPNYGGDGLPLGDEIAAVVEALESYSSTLSGHYTLQLTAWDDGDMSASITHTKAFVTDPDTLTGGIREEVILYDSDREVIEYQDRTRYASKSVEYHDYETLSAYSHTDGGDDR